MKEKKKQTHRRLFSRVISKQFCSKLRENSILRVENQGFFTNVIEENIIRDVVPKFYG